MASFGHAGLFPPAGHNGPGRTIDSNYLFFLLRTAPTSDERDGKILSIEIWKEKTDASHEFLLAHLRVRGDDTDTFLVKIERGPNLERPVAPGDEDVSRSSPSGVSSFLPTLALGSIKTKAVELKLAALSVFASSVTESSTTAHQASDDITFYRATTPMTTISPRAWPKPLARAVFTTSQPTLLHLSVLLLATTKAFPHYRASSSGRQCYWFAGTVFDAARNLFSGELRSEDCPRPDVRAHYLVAGYRFVKTFAAEPISSVTEDAKTAAAAYRAEVKHAIRCIKECPTVSAQDLDAPDVGLLRQGWETCTGSLTRRQTL